MVRKYSNWRLGRQDHHRSYVVCLGLIRVGIVATRSVVALRGKGGLPLSVTALRTRLIRSCRRAFACGFGNGRFRVDSAHIASHHLFHLTHRVPLLMLQTLEHRPSARSRTTMTCDT